ncbi:MAG TPA: RluA family pseudouridine synthase [Caldimonas sp.]|nr:RluA family pseudouridine synthase [Caldimonas sp.]
MTEGAQRWPEAETIGFYMAASAKDIDARPRAEGTEDLATEPADEVPERRAVLVDAALHGGRLDKALVAMAPEFSRSHLQGLAAAGHVSVDGVVVRQPARKVRAGQRLEVVLVPTEESRAFRAEPMPLPIVFEDEHLIVIDKPAGLVVHPAAGHWTGTLLNGLLAYVPAAAALPRGGIVHRLDKDTSGLMVVAKTSASTLVLSRAIAERQVRREYLAIAHGTVRRGEFTIDLPIGRDPRSRVRMGVVASGRPARTDVRRLAAAEGCTVLACRLQTGRTHQIRVHLAAQGHPLVADALYGGTPALGLHRQALHAARLGFMHPVGGQPLAFESRPPADLRAALDALGVASATP